MTGFIPHQTQRYTDEDMLARSMAFFRQLDARRSVRHFSCKPVPKQVIEYIIQTASTAPSGAHKQPWTFCLVQNPDLKKQIRLAAEKEERESYGGRMSPEWLHDLKPFGTDWQKPFLETAPWLIVMFKRPFEFTADGQKHQNYYVNESCGIACGMLLAAIHQAGLAALTHTPSPMGFLSKILQRPENEKPFLLIPVGHAAEDCQVPDLKRKSLEQVSVWYH